MSTYYRIQEADDPAARLLDTECQASHQWGVDTNTRHGVSACESLEDLAAYLAQSGIPFGAGDWNLITLEGDESDEEDHDADLGAVLVIPTAIVSVEPLSDDFYEMVGEAFDALSATAA